MKKGWIETTLGDVCIKITDGAHGSPKSVSDGLPMASVKDMTPFGINISSCRHISFDDFDVLVKQGCKPEVGDVLIAKDGASALDTVCEVRTPLNIVLLSSVAILRPDKCKIISAYLRFYLDAETTRSYMKAAFITGAAIPRVVLQDFKRTKISIPPLHTQRKTVCILSSYDDLIENNARRIQILEEMARMIYREWFVNFRFPGHESVKKVDSPLGMIPEGWKTGRLLDFCKSTSYGFTASAQKESVGPKFLRITDIVPDVIDWENVPYCEISEKDIGKYLLQEGDIVVARTGATVGYAKRLNKRHPKTIYASYLVRLRLTLSCASLYAGILVESTEFKTFIKQNASGAAQPQANAQVLTSIPFVMPTESILQQFNSIVQPFFDQKEILELKNRTLRQTRDLLLPKLISGEIDVADLDIPI